MPEQDGKDDLFDGILDGDDLKDDDSVDSAESSDPASGSSDDSKDAKRIRDLMSRAQKAEAEAAKLRKQIETQQKPEGSQPETPTVNDEFSAFMRESVRRQIFAEAKLDAFGLEPSAIEGRTVDEMQASAKRYTDLLGGLRDQVRGEVLKEHGLTPDAGGSSGGTQVDYAALSPEEFEKLVDRTLGRD